MVRKGNPQTFTVPLDRIAGTTGFQVINQGLYLKGDKPFYCSLRVAQAVHGEIVTSKGKAGIGKLFHSVSAPNGGSSSFNFTTGILATEDNTSVTVTWPNVGQTFLGANPQPTTNTHTFTLDKGKSFVFAQNTNTNSFIGAKIEADKPITVTNGNANGNFGANASSGSDLILDQSVPVERLGNTFAMVKTRSTQPSLNMEGGIIVATEDNTQIFVNGGTTPLATINAGQWYRINETNYVLSTPGSGHYNMFISTTKNVYLYQFIGVGNLDNTGGFNYIPPLNCFLPRKIDEIGKINEMPPVSTSSISLKLNILTETGADVLINGVAPTAAEGPFPLTGNTQWVTYAKENITGNITINSTKAVTAGINGGYSSAGYGGYFAGFSSIPVIAKQTGDCIPGLILEVDDSYETYQWFLNGVAITGATTHTITPSVAGDYTVRVTMGTCPPVTTPVYKAFTCLQETIQSINICGNKTIVPTFTSSTQTPVPSTVVILTAPTKGTATINPTTGIISYVPNQGATGTDQIVYKFCGNATEFIDCEQVTLNLNVVPFVINDATIKACQYFGKGYFDLTSAPVTTYTPNTKKFYLTMADLDAGTNEITNPTNYFSGQGHVFVEVKTDEGCIATAKITLDFYPTPVVNEDTLTECFIENDDTRAQFNLTTANITSETSTTRKYYPTFTDASNGTNEIVAMLDSYISANGAVYARVINGNNCHAIAKINLIVTPPKKSPTLVDKYICIDARTTLDAGPGYDSYLWSTGQTTQSIDGVPVGDYWVVLEDNGCYTKQTVSVKKVLDPVITAIELSNTTATVIVSGGNAPFEYSVDGTTNWQDSNVFTNLSRGEHTFFVRDKYMCNPVSVQITVPNIINAITPNGDNVNDYLDYSALSYKRNLTFTIYDRYGNQVFVGDKFNNYKWDGTQSNKKIITGTYWYHINWVEPNSAKTQIKLNGWILVKNRD